MKVEVHFFGIFRNLADRSDQIIELSENETIRKLLDILIDQYAKMSSVLSPEKIGKSHVLIIHGENAVNNFDAILSEGDKLYLFVMLAGG